MEDVKNTWDKSKNKQKRLDGSPHPSFTHTDTNFDDGELDMRLISITEACEWLGIGRWSVYKLIDTNALRTVKIGARRLVSIKAVKDYISALEDAA